MSIPKNIFQTTRHGQPDYVINMIKEKSNGWNYQHFNDSEIIKYFIDYPNDEFPHIIDKFNQLKFGAHKADLFRYYYLYTTGGVFIDSDAMLEDNIENIVQDYTFFSVKSLVSNTIFQGFIGSVPRNKIIYEALKDVYNIDINYLTNNYHLLTANMYTIINEGIFDFKYKLYTENGNDGEKVNTENDDNKIILIHYWRNKNIPYR